MASFLRKLCEESRAGDSGVQGGFVVAAAESAVPVNLDADYDRSGGSGVVVDFGEIGSRKLGCLLLWLAWWGRVRWGVGLYHVVGIRYVSF